MRHCRRSARTKWAAPSAVTTWKRARRRWRGGLPPALVERPRTGPAGDRLRWPAVDRQRRRWRAELATPADPTGARFVGDDGGDAAPRRATTTAGDGAGRAPGHGPRGVEARTQAAGRVVGVGQVGGRRRHPAVAVTGQPPPRHAGTSTDSSPTRPVSRATARAARSSAADGPPHRRSWSPPSPRTSSASAAAARHRPTAPPEPSSRRAASAPARPSPAPTSPPPGTTPARCARRARSRRSRRGGCTPAPRRQLGDELVGEVLADEDERLELLDRVSNTRSACRCCAGSVACDGRSSPPDAKR